MENEDFLRRPIPQRASIWAQKIAQYLAEKKVAPNTISFAGVVFAALAAAFMMLSGMTVEFSRSFLLFLAAAAVVCRLLCNMFDGMVAVEGGLGAKDGALWNELPDRIADTFILVGAGYAAASDGNGGEWVGYWAAILAVLTAYIREIGSRLGMNADFSGPFAKPQRMWAIIVACIICMFEGLWGWDFLAMKIALWVVVLGTAYTCYKRAKTLRHFLLNNG